jgi:hypothetical protein
MIKVNHMSSSNKTYNDYVDSYKTDRLSKFIKIYTFERFNGENIIFESFDKLYKDTNYNIVEYYYNSKDSNFNKIPGYKIWFDTNSNNKYRIDLMPLKNFNKDIDSDFVFNISFTLDKYSIDDPNYDDLTGLNEEKEVLLRIGDILNNLDINKYFVIGETIIDKKMRIYKHILTYVFKDFKIKMSYCEGFINNNGLYIWK